MRRWALRILAFLLLGAIVNVAVAWVCAARVPLDATWVYPAAPRHEAWQPLRDVGYDRDGFLRVTRWQRGGSTRVSMAIGDFYHWPDGNPTGAPMDECPGWCRERMLDTIVRSKPTLLIVEARGWPVRTLWCEPATVDLMTPGVTSPVGGIEISERFATPSDRFTKPTLPLIPIWPGFAINTVFYAVIVWLLFAGPFVVRRWRRIRRGLCPKCAYDLRGSDSEACPECGATVPRRSHQAAH